jgi:hypothetical protein
MQEQAARNEGLKGPLYAIEAGRGSEIKRIVKQKGEARRDEQGGSHVCLFARRARGTREKG